MTTWIIIPIITGLCIFLFLIFYLIFFREKEISYNGKWKVLDWRYLENNGVEITTITSCGRVCVFAYDGSWRKISGHVKMDENIMSFLYRTKKDLIERDRRSSSVWEKIHYMS